MARLILFLAILAGLALGLSWLVDRPGELVLTWQGMRVETTVAVAIGCVAALCFAFLLLWTFLRFIFRLPSLLALAARARRRNRGYTALSRGMIAAAAGDRRYAARATREAEKLLGEDPLTLLLRAQTAQLDGDRRLAETTFARMVDRPETRLLGLRGLHAEALRRDDAEAAHHYAAQAHRIAPLGWAGEAMLDWHVRRGEWARALDVVEANRTHKGVARGEADRQRAVLLTALARESAERDPEGALKQAREAVKLAPSLVPAAALAGRLLARRGDLRKAARLIEAAWRRAPHPELAETYVHLRPGDAAQDRLERARALAALAPHDAESALTLARAALEARDFRQARQALAPLLAAGGSRPTRRLCLLMADLEQTEHGPRSGGLREWLARAASAAHDPAWIADEIISDRWEPASPVTGKLDAFHWAAPQERLSDPDAAFAFVEADETDMDAALEAAPADAPRLPAAEPELEREIEAKPETPAPTPPASRPRPLSGASALYPMPVVPDDPGPRAEDAGGESQEPGKTARHF